MKDTELYINYLDGLLDEVSEQEFISKFSKDDGFRIGFKNFINITSTIKSNISAYGPSVAETNAIFSKLGYAVPSAIPVSGTVQISNGFFKSMLLKNLLIALGASLFTLILTLVFIKPELQNFTNTKKREIIQNFDLPELTIYQPNEELFAEGIQSVSNGNLFGFNNSHSNISQSNDISESNADDLTGGSNFDKNFEVTESNSKIILNYSDLISEKFKITVPNKTNKMYNSLDTKIDFNPHIRNHIVDLEVKSSSNWNLPKETIYPNDISKINNLSLTLLYNLSEKIKSGIELRQETFFAQFSGIENSQLFKYSQQPNFLSIGLSARYELINNLNYSTFLQINLGFNKFGIIGRNSLGLEYLLYDDISLILIAEFSNLWFKHQENWFDSKKLGIHYGVNFKF